MSRAPLPALAAVAVLVAGCGGGKSDEDTIRSIVEDGSAHPQTICDNLTRTALRQLGGAAKCRKLASSQDNTDPHVRIDSVTVAGDHATAKVTGKAGHQTIRFVREDGRWRVSPG